MGLVTTIFGVQVPTLVFIFLIAGVLQLVINRILQDLRVYHYVWHPGLFRTALFICLFSIPSLIIYN